MSAILISANPAYSMQLGAAYMDDSLKLLAVLLDSCATKEVQSGRQGKTRP
jgi:hypothetical protein